MSTNLMQPQPDAHATAPWRIHLVEANHPMFRNSVTDLAAKCRTGKAAYMTNVISCLSLWMSLLVAIWFVRGLDRIVLQRASALRRDLPVPNIG